MSTTYNGALSTILLRYTISYSFYYIVEWERVELSFVISTVQFEYCYTVTWQEQDHVSPSTPEGVHQGISSTSFTSFSPISVYKAASIPCLTVLQSFISLYRDTSVRSRCPTVSYVKRGFMVFQPST